MDDSKRVHPGMEDALEVARELTRKDTLTYSWAKGDGNPHATFDDLSRSATFTSLCGREGLVSVGSSDHELPSTCEECKAEVRKLAAAREA